MLLIPGLIFLILFKYVPMYGLVIAFQEFNIFDGVRGSTWVGFDNFIKLTSSEDFMRVFSNTVIISFAKIIFLFPVPIALAIMLNEVRIGFLNKGIQTLVFLPHFLSWVIIAGLFTNILAESSGLVNSIIQFFGGTPVSFLQDNDWFRTVLVFTSGWKESGWNSIVFLAAISGIDQDIYDAAKIDGAGRFTRIFRITIPSIMSVIILMFILRIGYVLEAGTEQILMLYNPIVYPTGDVIGTFVYREGLGKMDYSFATAVGMFQSFVGFILVVGGNALSRKFLQRGIW